MIFAVLYDKAISRFYIHLFYQFLANSLRLVKTMDVSLWLPLVAMLLVLFNLVHLFAQRAINFIFSLSLDLT